MSKNNYFCNQNKKQCMLEIIRQFLQYRGITINDINESTFSFTTNGLNYTFVHDRNDDPYYFRLILPNVLQVNSANRGEILNRINDRNVRFKVAKSVIVNNNVWIVAEQFVYSHDRITDLFERTMELLQAYIIDFRNEQQI